MKRSDITHKIGEIVDQVKFEPKDEKTRDHIDQMLNILKEEVQKEGWFIWSGIYTVDNAALMVISLIRHESETRPTPPDVIWIEDPEQTDTDAAFEKAMSVVE